jgi:hypothetical protein
MPEAVGAARSPGDNSEWILMCIFFFFIDQMLTIHYYLLFDGPEELWQHTKAFYNEGSIFRY